jgi:pre-mRNA-splicing factor 38A
MLGLPNLLLRYLRALAAFYVRMTFRPVDIYEVLEPMLRDYGKLRMRNMGEFSMYEF